MIMKRPIACGLALALAGCVGTHVEVGGAERVTAVPANHVDCVSANLKRVKLGPRYVPDDVSMFFFLSDNYHALQSMLIEFDIPSTGRPMNIHYVGPRDALQNGTKQKIIRSAADMVAGSVYAWPGEAGYAVGCKLEMDYIINWERTADGVVGEARKPK